MADGGAPILPQGISDPAQIALKALELGRAEVTKVSAELKVLAQTVRLEAQVIRINDNGTVTLQTPRGEVDVKPPVQLQPGQTVQVRLEAGAPPVNARLALPPQTTPVQSEALQQTQTTNTQTSLPTQTLPSETSVSPRAAQRFDQPTIPLGSTVPAQFVSLPIPPSQTGVEVLLTTLFNAGNLNTAAPAPPQNPLSSLAQIAQATLPPPIVEGIQNVQLLKLAFVGRNFNLTPLLNNLLGTQPITQNLPVTGLQITQPPTAISPLTILSNSVGQTPVINTEKPITGISTILSSLFNGGPINKQPQIQTQPSAACILFTQAPGQLLQIPNLPIATTQTSGQPNSLFFGVTLGQTAVGDFAVLGTNGIAIIPKVSVTGPLLPGTVLIAQGQGITPSPNINLFNIPVVNVQSGFLNFDPLFGDRWPVLDEVLNVLTQIDPSYAASVRQSIPNVSNPAQLPTSILFFIAATGIGDVRAWVGDKAFDALIQAGRTELSTLLGNDFASIASRASEQTPDGWRPFMVPMFFGDALHRMQFFTRHHYEDGEDGQAGTKQTRFLVNVTQTKLGPLQLDGLVNEHRLDMVLRSDDILPQEMRQGIRQHYSDALKEGGLAGAINFEHGTNQWVDVDTAPSVDQSVFI